MASSILRFCGCLFRNCTSLLLSQLVILGLISITSLPTFAADSPALGLSRLIDKARVVAPCSSPKIIGSFSVQNAALCDFIALFDQHETDKNHRDGFSAASAIELAQLLNNYLQASGKGGQAATTDEIKERANILATSLQRKELPYIPGLTLIPVEVCMFLGVAPVYCVVPACLIDDGSASGSAKCPVTPLKLNELDLADKAKKWRTETGRSDPCADGPGICMPIDPKTVAMRDYLLTQGRQLVMAAAAKVASGGNPQVLADSLRGDLQCWVNRNAALHVAHAVEAAFNKPADALNRLGSAVDAVAPSRVDIERNPSARCDPNKTDALYSATSTVIQAALYDATRREVAMVTPDRSILKRNCNDPGDHPEQFYEFKQSSDGIIKSIRLRPPESGNHTSRLFLVLRDLHYKPDPTDSSCSPGEFEFPLGIDADIAWVNGAPRLAGPFGSIGFYPDANLDKSVEKLLPVRGFSVSTKAALAATVLPLSLEVTLNIPGIDVPIAMPKVTIDATQGDYGLRSLLDVVQLRANVNTAIAKALTAPIAVHSLGISIQSLKWSDVNGDKDAVNFEAVVAIPALKELTPGIEIMMYLAGPGDPQARHLTIRPAALPPIVISGLRARLLARINQLLANIPGSQSFGALKELNMRLATISTDSLRVQAALSFPGTALPDFPIDLEIPTGSPSLDVQLDKQFRSLADQLTNRLAAYVREELRSNTQLLANDLVSRLKASLPPSYPLFGSTWAVKNVSNDSQSPRAICFDVENTQRQAIDSLCTRQLDPTGLPVLDWQRAHINDVMVSWIASQVSALSRAPYFSVGLIGAELNSGHLYGNVVVSVLDAKTPVPVRVDFGSTGTNINFGTDEIAAVVIAAAREQLQTQLSGREVSVGAFSLSEITLPSAGVALTVQGLFKSGDWFSGHVAFDLFPKFVAHAPTDIVAGPALKTLMGFQTGPFVIEGVTPDPLAVRFAVALSEIPLLSIIPDVHIPTVHIEAPLHGSPHVIEPIEFPVPGEIPIPPYFVITNSFISLYPQTKPFTFQAGTDLTVATGVMADVIKVHATLTADLQKFLFEFHGPLTVLSIIELAHTDGMLDMHQGLATMESGSSGWLKELAPTSMKAVISGPECRFTQHVSGSINVLQVSVDGRVAIQAPCGSSNEGCPARGAGSACISGDIKLGPLGDAQGNVGASLDFRQPVASVLVHSVDVGFGMGKPSIDVSVASRYSRAALQAGPFSIEIYAPSIQDINPGMIIDLVKEALSLHFSLDALKNRKIILSLLPQGPNSNDPPSDLENAQAQTRTESKQQRATDNPPASTPPPGSKQVTVPATAASGGTPASSENAFAPGPWSIAYTDEKGNKDGPPTWRHWLRKSPDERLDSEWLMNAHLGGLLKDKHIWPYPELINSPTLIGAPDAVVGPPESRKYQVFFADTTLACPSGVCVAPLDVAIDTDRNVADDSILQTLFGVSGGYLGKAVIENSQLLENTARLHALGDLAVSAWEGKPTVSKLQCLSSLKNDCAILLMSGQQNTDATHYVKKWIYASDTPHWYATWLIHDDSLLDLTASQTMPEILVEAIQKNISLWAITRSGTEVLLCYQSPGTPNWFLSLWDTATAHEIKKIAVTNSCKASKAINETLTIATPKSFGSALIDYVKTIDPSAASNVTMRMTSRAVGYLFRERLPDGKEKVLYLSVPRFDVDYDREMASTTFCARTGSGDSLSSALLRRKNNGEVPSAALIESDSAIDYIVPFIGIEPVGWRQAGFLANPTSLLDLDATLQQGVCTL